MIIYDHFELFKIVKNGISLMWVLSSKMHSVINKLFRFDILDFFLFSNDHEITNISGQRTEVIGRKIQSPCNAYMYITILPLTVEKIYTALFRQITRE